MQVVDYDSTPEAALYVAADGVVDRVPLRIGDSLEYALEGRHCAGRTDGTSHEACENPQAPWCPVHQETWICARCRGTCLKDVMDCHDPHVVYLAIVAPDLVKVGVTKAHRIETRLHEQGADRGVVIREVENGRIAREIESEIGEQLPDRIPTRHKMRSLDASVDEDRWQELIAPYEVISTHHPEYALDIEDAPIPERLARGTVRGTKGRLLVLSQQGSTYVTDLRDLVGHEVAPGPSDRRLQAGLGAFG